VLVKNTAKAESLSAIVPVGQEPFKVAVNPISGNVYVANSASNTVSVISPNNQVTATIPVGVALP
jgi:YVTN family beta-propeller protein